MNQVYSFPEGLIMSKLKKAVLFLLCIALLIFPTVPQASAQRAEPLPAPSLSAQSAVLIEAESGERAYQKNADMPLPMASTTKIMTALVALELSSPERVITVSAEAVGTEGSSVYLTEGEQLTLEQLLYALLLESANDAAIAIAIGTAVLVAYIPLLLLLLVLWFIVGKLL